MPKIGLIGLLITVALVEEPVIKSLQPKVKIDDSPKYEVPRVELLEPTPSIKVLEGVNNEATIEEIEQLKAEVARLQDVVRVKDSTIQTLEGELKTSRLFTAAQEQVPQSAKPVQQPTIYRTQYSNCANGSCNTQQGQYRRRGLFGFRR